MKKILLTLISLPLFYFSFAQSPTKCLTCKDGAHDGMIDKALTHSSAGHNVGDGNATLGQSYLVQNLCGLNYVMNGLQTTTRYTSSIGSGFPTTVAIAGLPAGFVVQKAFVYYGCSYTEASPPATSVAITNPAAVNNTFASTMIGQGSAVCWGETGTCSYRCDVTSMISGNGNYSINLTGFANAGYEVDGVSLMIIYVDPAAIYSGNIAIYDGDMADFTGTSMTYNASGFTACTASSSGSTFGLFGDMQNNISPNTNTEDFNNSIASFPNNFWNTNIWPTSVAACQTTSTFTGYTNNTNDCWLWTMAGLYWQYSTCTACSAMTVTSVDVNPSCGNNNGSITLNVVGGTAPYTYTWTPNVSTTASATGLAPGNYQITVQDAACNVVTINVTLTMVNLVITNTLTNILCAGQANGTITYTVSGGTPPYTYTWTPNVSTTAGAAGLSAGTYTTVISDLNGCASTETLTITQPPALTDPIALVNVTCNALSNGTATAAAAGGVPPYTYAWSTGSSTNVASGLSAGIYTIVLTDNNGCTLTSTATITQPTALAVNVTGPQTICANTSGTLTATVTGGTSPYAYSWSGGSTSTSSTAVVKPASSQTYTVTVTDANGCITTGTFAVVLGPVLTVTIAGPSSMCNGMSATLCATPGGGTGGNTYTWLPGNLTGPCVVVSPGSTTVYTVTAMDNCGSIATATYQLNINPSPAISFSADVYQGCSPLCVQFRNTTTISSGGVGQYYWTFGDGDTSHARNPAYCYANNGSYSLGLTETSDSGCSSTLNILNMITVYSRPNVAFSLSPQPATIIAPNIQFTDKTTDTYGLSYWWWTFGDSGDSSSNLQNPSHTYQDTGTYCAKLVVMDVHGCTDTAINCLVIDPVFNLYIPNAFSPNGDGKNDVFMPVGQYIKTFEMYIFDRWGMQLYHTNNILEGWNGTVKGGGQVSQEDTYVYKIYVTDSQNKQHSFIGNVTLIK